ncbi:hypothetical protein GCM10010191_43690 [Actinomadura vinacea]|uniref:DMT family transporter n=1 Tax=Actinomadura vinacea TaxID=115336 RepID=A0ABP5WFQ4_9ACTN
MSAGVAIPILMVILTMLLGQVGTFLSIKTGFLKEVDALTTSCVTGIVMSVVLWIRVRPWREKASWALWWRAVTIGIVIVGTSIAGDTAFRVLEVATVTALMVVATSHISVACRIVAEWTRGRRGLGDLRWLAGSLCGVLLLSPPGAVSPTGLFLVVAGSASYHLTQKFRSDLPDDDLDTYSALSRLPMVPFFFVLLFYYGDGAAGVVDMGLINFLICVWAGVVGSIISLVRNTAWKKGVRAVGESMLNPLIPALTALVGVLAGQTLPWPAFVGIGLIVLSSIGGARSDLRQQKAEQQQGSD